MDAFGEQRRRASWTHHDGREWTEDCGGQPRSSDLVVALTFRKVVSVWGWGALSPTDIEQRGKPLIYPIGCEGRR
jgi:hypothetical protein